MITTRAFWLGALERAVKTFCQVFLAVALLSLGDLTVGVDAGLTNVDWTSVLSVSALATFFSVVTSVGNARFTAGEVVTPAAVAPAAIYRQTTGEDDGPGVR